jgi:putative PEP-CTERM system histidine kinase
MEIKMAIAFAGAMLCIAEAVVILWWDFKSVAHLSFALGMLLLGLEAILDGFTAISSTPQAILRLQSYALVTKAFLPAAWLLFSLTYARGNYAEFLKKWRFVIVGALVVPLLALFAGPRPLLNKVQIFAGTDDWVLSTGSFGVFLDAFFLVCAVLVLMNLESTFRSSVGTMRWRIKFLVLGLALLFAVRIYTSSQTILFSSTSSSLKGINATGLLVSGALIAVALVRGRKFTVDIYPSQKLLYMSLTVLLAGLYLITVGALANVLRVLGIGAGLFTYSFLVLLAVTGLAAFAFSEKLRQSSKLLISRHFNRPLHDYRQIWTAFTERTSSVVDEAELCRAVTSFVSQTFDVLSASIWVYDASTDKLSFGASTILSETAALERAELQKSLKAIAPELIKNPNPIEIDSSGLEWAAEIKKWVASSFRTGGKNHLVPLVAKGDLMGILMLSDRVNALSFSTQDFDLLKCLADQAANDLLSIRLSQKLLRAKQLEAFQTISAFFVHDLKNTASSLSLTLRNMPNHFEDPSFRKDALRALSNSVTHLNGVIGRLSTLKQEIRLQAHDADLNAIVQDVLLGLDPTLRAKVATEFSPPCKVHVDSDQICKVVTNLVLNANDAVNERGDIRISTTTDNGWVVLSVADSGCGMSQDFIRENLFRPFQTTKKNGTGIGMFQSKLIVEAHKGRIEVDSTENQGTTFRVMLPIETA